MKGLMKIIGMILGMLGLSSLASAKKKVAVKKIDKKVKQVKKEKAKVQKKISVVQKQKANIKKAQKKAPKKKPNLTSAKKARASLKRRAQK